MDHGEVRAAAASGELRYIVADDYLDLPHEREFFDAIAGEFNGHEVARFESAEGTVRVIELRR